MGTKVDQGHANWVTAYNMLTGIRFTVSRTNAKLDRALTDADFGAKHKFSFDVYDHFTKCRRRMLTET
jgi:1-phosphatidylinositol-4-phosphate 5-kinase